MLSTPHAMCEDSRIAAAARELMQAVTVFLLCCPANCYSRLQVSQIPELLDAAPREELQSILQLLCSMFNTKNGLISLFADRRIYIINGTGMFQVCCSTAALASSGRMPVLLHLCWWCCPASCWLQQTPQKHRPTASHPSAG
jgi:ferredoxin-like protein FixX